MLKNHFGEKFLQAIGTLIMIIGFTGVPCLGLAGLSKNLPVSLVLHFLLVLSYFIYAVNKEGSIKSWYLQRVNSIYNVHPIVVVFIGLLFSLMGVYSMAFIEPGNGPDALNLSESIYAGSIFTLIGVGAFLVSLKDCFYLNPK